MEKRIEIFNKILVKKKIILRGFGPLGIFLTRKFSNGDKEINGNVIDVSCYIFNEGDKIENFELFLSSRILQRKNFPINNKEKLDNMMGT